MKSLKTIFKNLIVFSLLFFTMPCVANTIVWSLVLRSAERTHINELLKATAITRENGQSFHYFESLAVSGFFQGDNSLSRLGIRITGCPLPAHGQNLITTLANAVVSQSSENSPLAVHLNQLSNVAVNFDLFPLHWLPQLGGSQSGLVLDRIHYINQNIVYVNLQPARESSEPAGNQESNAELDEGVANAGFENEEQRDNPEIVAQGAKVAEAETRSEPVIGVILQRYTREELRQRRRQREPQFEYRLIVILQRLDDDTVSTVVNNTATAAEERRVHFETHLNSETLFNLSQFTQSPLNHQVLSAQPEASPEERSYFRVFLQYVLTHCLCCCMASGTYRVSPR